MYFVAADAVVILDVFSKKTETTPKTVVNRCRQRLASYQRAASEKKR
jgi:phage-related protein